MNTINIMNIEIQPWIWAPAVYFIWVFILQLVKKIVFKRIRLLTDKTKTEIDY